MEIKEMVLTGPILYVSALQTAGRPGGAGQRALRVLLRGLRGGCGAAAGHGQPRPAPGAGHPGQPPARSLDSGAHQTSAPSFIS